MDKEDAIKLASLDYDFRYSTYYTYDEFLERTMYHDIDTTTRNGQDFVEIDYTWYDG